MSITNRNNGVAPGEDFPLQGMPYGKCHDEFSMFVMSVTEQSGIPAFQYQTLSIPVS